MIHLIQERYSSGNAERDAELQECKERNNKVKFILHGITTAQRPTYRQLFEYANEATNPGDKVIIANSDIYFLPEISVIEKLPLSGICLALSRWDEMPDGRLKPHHQPDSQDCWIFEAPIKIPLFCDFTTGEAGCDNRIAFELHAAGYRIYNPCQEIKAIHLHNSGIRTYTDAGRIPPPYKMVHPTSLAHIFGKKIANEL